METLFELGQLLITPGALAALEEAGESPTLFLFRHAAGDWGDLTTGDLAANALALKNGSRILSSYRLANTGAKLWIITEAVGEDGHRAATTLLLPSEY